MSKVILNCLNLCKTYQENNIKIKVLNNISFSVLKGEMIAIIGSSGSGKSTLLHLLGGLDNPTSGEIIFSGKSITKMSLTEKAQFRNQNLGFIYQFHHLLLDFTVLENIAMPLLIDKHKLSEVNFRALNILKEVGLEHCSKCLPYELSGGERQRVAIARALVNNPNLVLADEPTGSLDAYNTDNICNLINKLNSSQGTTFIIVTHNMRIARYMDRQLEIRYGQLINNNLNSI